MHMHTIQRNKSRTTTPYSSILTETEIPEASKQNRSEMMDAVIYLPRPCDDVTSFHFGDEYHN